MLFSGYSNSTADYSISGLELITISLNGTDVTNFPSGLLDGDLKCKQDMLESLPIW
jgi:hypothetical protein